MEVKKSESANLERKRLLFFEIGLALSLCLALFAFEWQWGSDDEDEFDENSVETITQPDAPMSAISIEQPVIPAPQQIAPPQIASSIQIVKNEVAVKQTITTAPTEADETTEIPEQTPPLPPAPLPDDQVFFKVDELPQFPGGDMALRTYLSNNIRYPKSAYNKKVQGIVYVQFIISKEGKVMSPRVAASLEPSLDSAALSIISKLPSWIPAKIATAPVNIAVTIPINFILDK